MLAPPRSDQQNATFYKIENHPAMIKERNKWNVKVLWKCGGPTYNLITKTKPVKTIDDLKGMKIRVGGSIGELLKTFGVVPVYTPAPEAMMAVSRGVVDGVACCGDYWVKAYKLDEVSKYYTKDMDMGAVGLLILINQKSYDALDDDIKEVLTKLEMEMIPLTEKYLSDPADVLRWHMENERKYGIEYCYFPPEDREKMVKAVQPIWDKWLKRTESVGGKEVFDAWMKAKGEIMKEYPNGVAEGSIIKANY
jgi:TRAP-type C4-dicarboxylate transport system substrate-binding protein